MAKTPYPPERKRVKIHGRVSPETYEKLLALHQPNIGRAVDELAKRLDEMSGRKARADQQRWKKAGREARARGA